MSNEAQILRLRFVDSLWRGPAQSLMRFRMNMPAPEKAGLGHGTQRRTGLGHGTR